MTPFAQGKTVPYLHLARLTTHLGEHSVTKWAGDKKGPIDIVELWFQKFSKEIDKVTPQEEAL